MYSFFFMYKYLYSQEFLTLGHVADQTEFNMALEEQGLFPYMYTYIGVHSVCLVDSLFILFAKYSFIYFNNYCPRSNYLHKLPIIYMYLLMLSGKYCMNLVDTDRSQYAREHGYRTSLCSLKPLSCTPKNNLIIGQRDS